MDSNIKQELIKEAKAYFSEERINVFLNQLNKWSIKEGELFYQVAQQRSAPLFVLGALEGENLLNFVMQEKNIRISVLPLSNITLIDYFFQESRGTLRVYFHNVTNAVRPEQYFDYTAFNSETENKLSDFATALTRKLSKEGE